MCHACSFSALLFISAVIYQLQRGHHVITKST
jgi:hypothetical protein